MSSTDQEIEMEAAYTTATNHSLPFIDQMLDFMAGLRPVAAGAPGGNPHLDGYAVSGTSPPESPASTLSVWITVNEFAASRGIHHQTVRKAIKDGRLPAEDWGSGEKPVYRIHRDAQIAKPRRSKAGPSVPTPSGQKPKRGRFAALLDDTRDDLQAEARQ